jgi:hypothetical protein
MAESSYKLFGQIQCQDVPSSRAIRSFVEKHIERWITGNEARIFSPGEEPRREAFHTVSLRRQGPGHQFVCHVRLKFPTGAWSGSSYGNGLHQTVLMALHNLSPVQPTPPIAGARLGRIPKLLPSAA